ncbi:MAG: MFS transporter [Acidimicrobiia bacterium]
MSFVRSLTSLGPRYLALWVGQAVSHFGTYVAWVTLPLLVLHLQQQRGVESTLDFAITYALETAPTLLLGLFVGVLIDRWHLRPIMIATDLLRASAFFYLAAGFGSYGIGTVFAVAFLVGSFTTFFDGALFALIPSLVPRRRLADANSFVAFSQQANFAIGALAAGVIAFASGGPVLGLFINGLSFVVSAVFLIWVGRVEHHRSASDQRTSFMREAMDGLRYMWSEPRLRITTIAAAVPNFVMGFIEATVVLLFYVILDAVNDAQVGILIAAMGVGGIIGALIAPQVIRTAGLGRTMTFGMIVTGFLLFAVMFTTYGALAFALNVGWMLGVSLMNVSLATIRQHYAEDNMLGRVITVSRAIGWATLPMGALVGGWLGGSEETLPVVARLFPALLVATAIWLISTVVWTDTFGPNFEGRHSRHKESPAEAA